MKNTLVFVTDLACFKAFKLENNLENRPPRLELLEEFNNEQAHERIVDQAPDLSGRFPRGVATSDHRGPMSDGDPHNLALELCKPMVRRLAGRLNSRPPDQKLYRPLLTTR